MSAGAPLPSCTEIEPQCARAGWLFKQSKHVKKWNKRYFILWPKEPKPNKGRLLFYYNTPQDVKPRGLIPLVPKTFTASIERVSYDMQKGTSLKRSLVINLCEREDYENITATYILANNDEDDIHAWAQLVGGEAAQGGGSLGPSSASSSGAGMMQAGGAFSLSSIKMIDPAPLFKAAQTGDVRTLAQLSLKMIEGANSTIGALGQQVAMLQRENAQLKSSQPGALGQPPAGLGGAPTAAQPEPTAATSAASVAGGNSGGRIGAQIVSGDNGDPGGIEGTAVAGQARDDDMAPRDDD